MEILGSNLNKEFELSVFYGSDLFNPKSLDNFDFGITEKDISVVIATYNRAHYPTNSKNATRNPLSWTINSLASQKRNVVKEIIVIDDNSVDYTNELIDSLEENVNEAGIDLIKLKNKTKIGSSRSRNEGIKIASGNFIFFSDDDCIFSEYSLAGSLYTFLKLKPERNIAALHLPVYYRNTKPRRDIKAKHITTVDLKKGEINADFSSFPSEYLNGHKNKFLDNTSNIFMPIEIDNMAGVFLSSKDHVIEAGRFPDYFIWPNAYREETVLSFNILKNGGELFYSPDPKLATIHFKSGFRDSRWLNEINEEELSLYPNGCGLTLREMLEETSIERLDTGNRVNNEEFAYSCIISNFFVFLTRDKNAAIQFGKRNYLEFVDENNIYSKYDIKVSGLEKRRKIWRKALEDCITLFKQVYGVDHSDIIEKI